MFATFDISTSGLVAQRTRLTAIANNIANLTTTRNEAGELSPYRGKYAIFETDTSVKTSFGGAGVRVKDVQESDAEPLWRWDPDNPDAQKEGPYAGYVGLPNISMMAEFTDALEATRAYEANIGVIEISKDLAQQDLRILA